MVNTTRYSVIFQKFPSRVRVAQKILSSIRVAGTRWGLTTIDILFPKAVPLIRAIELLESHFEKGFGVLTAVQVSLLLKMEEMLTVGANLTRH